MVDGLLGTLAFLAVLAVVLAGSWRLAARIRRRGNSDAVMGPFDEIWHPSAHTSRIEIQQQLERPAPSPAPGDRMPVTAARPTRSRSAEGETS